MGSVVDSQLCKIGITAAALHHEEPDLFEEMMHFVDPRAGQWPPPVVEGLAAVAELCIQFHARKRASVRDVVPQQRGATLVAEMQVRFLHHWKHAHQTFQSETKYRTHAFVQSFELSSSC